MNNSPTRRGTMKKLFSTENIGYWLLIAAFGIILELGIAFAPLITLTFAALLIYFGMKKKSSRFGTILKIIGIIMIILTIMQSVVFKITLFFIIMVFFYQAINRKKQQKTIHVETVSPELKQNFLKKEPFIKNFIFGNQKVLNHVYELDDINIQTGIGDTVIDLGMTMLPAGETTIIIRGFIGNIQLLVPYDVEVSVNHSVIAGKTKIFESLDEGFNYNTIYYSENYQEAPRKIKVLTSLIIGDLGVKNV